MKARKTPEASCESALEALAAAAPRLRLREHAPEFRDHRLALLGLLQELRSLVERRDIKLH